MSEINEQDKALRDASIKALREHIGPILDEHLEKAYAGREQRLQGQVDLALRGSAATRTWDEATERKSPIGAVSFALMQAKGNRDQAIDSVTKYLGESVTRTVNISQAAEGGVLIASPTLESWFDALAPRTAVLSLNPQRVPMPDRTMSVPGWTGRPSFTWTGEVNQTDIVSTPAAGARKLSARKGMALVEVSNSMLRTTAGPRIARFIERLCRREVAIGLDTAYLRGAGTDFTPRGIRWLAATTTAMTATPTLATSLQDLATAIQALEGANVDPAGNAWIMNPLAKNWLMFRATDGFGHPFWLQEMRQGTLLSYPYRATNILPANLGVGGNESELYHVAMEHILVGEVLDGGIRVEYFNEGSFTEGGQTRSLMQRDTQAVRLVAETDIETEYPQAIHVTTGLTWSPSL